MKINFLNYFSGSIRFHWQKQNSTSEFSLKVNLVFFLFAKSCKNKHRQNRKKCGVYCKSVLCTQIASNVIHKNSGYHRGKQRLMRRIIVSESYQNYQNVAAVRNQLTDGWWKGRIVCWGQRVLYDLQRTRLSRRRMIWLLLHPLPSPARSGIHKSQFGENLQIFAAVESQSRVFCQGIDY